MSFNMTTLAVVLALLVVAGTGWKMSSRSAYESAGFQLVSKQGAFEIRDYPALPMAVTDMAFAKSAGNGSFQRLFRYISGSNNRRQKIAMTTPVFMDPEQGDASGQMSFVLPAGLSPTGGPEPTEPRVRLAKRPAGRFAVLRFSGRITEQSTGEMESRLRHWMADNGLIPEGPAGFAGYDPPWIPGVFRLNEVLIRITADHGQTATGLR